MNPFQKLVSDIFNNTAFLQKCVLNGVQYCCIKSSTNNDMLYNQSGAQDFVNFSLDLKVSDLKAIPKINDKVYYQDEEYKIVTFEKDSAGQSIKIFLNKLNNSSN